jgi:L-asparagine transporter-like permease
MDYFTTYIYLIFIVKFIFIILAATHLYLKSKKKENTNIDKKIVYWKERTELLFIVLMAILLIFLFNPTTSQAVIINGNSKILLYLFGIVLLVTANWKQIFTPSPWFSNLQQIIGNNR